jgi:TolA-binding protein
MMIKYIVIFVVAVLPYFNLLAQVPTIEQTLFPSRKLSSKQWMDIRGYHAARQQAEELLNVVASSEDKRDVLFVLSQSAFEDQEYEIAYRWSKKFMDEYPNDVYFGSALFVNGISAFQISRTEESNSILTQFLEKVTNHPKRGAAFFWRAMCKLEFGNEQGAQSDVKQCYADSASRSYHDLALYGWALSLERSKKYEEAVVLLEQILRDYPSSQYTVDVKIRLASIFLRVGEPEKAVVILEGVDPLPPQRQEYSLIRAESNVQSNRFEMAQIDFSKFIERFPKSKYIRNARYGLAWSYLKQGNYSAARKELDSLGAGNDSLSFISLYQSAVLALLQDKQPEALVRFDSLTEKSPYDRIAENAYFHMGVTHYRSKRYKEARRAFQLAARLFPESNNRARSYRMLGETNMALGDFSNAQYAFSRVRQLNGEPQYLQPAMFQEAVCLYHLGRFKSSSDLLGEFLKKYPGEQKSAQALVWRGEALYQDGKFAESELSYSKALQQFPNNPQKVDASYGLAWSLFEQKKFSRAASAFSRFIDENKNDERALEATLRQADCFYFLGEYEKSNSLYGSVAEVKKNSRYAEYAAFQIAMAYIQRGESERGIEQLRLFISKFPESLYNEVVQFNIGWTYFSKNQFTEAVAEFRKLFALFPQSQLMPRVLFNMGDAFYNLKQYDSARVYYGRVTKEFPASPLMSDALQGLQFTYEAEGRPKAALAEIDTLMLASNGGISQEELVLKKGDILFSQGDFGGAVLQYQKLFGMKPDRSITAKAYYQTARAYEMENNAPEAARYYQRVLLEYGDMDFTPNVALALGINLLKSKQYRDAASSLRGFGDQYPHSPLLSEADYNYALALLSQQKKEEAIDAFQNVIKKQPDDVFADRSRLQIARIYFNSKQYKKSLDSLEQIIKRRNDDVAAEALLMVGDNYLSLKKPADALQAFKDVYDQYSEYPLLVERAHFGAGTCYEKLRNKNSARSEYERVVKSGLDPVIKKDAEGRIRRLRK